MPGSILFQLPSYDDYSVQVLHEIFGAPIDNIYNIATPSQNGLITAFLSHFDVAMASAFMLIFAIIIVVGTLNTAHEGKFLGRDWNSVWVPIRAVIGPVMILPIKGGFCAIQYLLMYAILIGINLATYVWQNSLADIQVDPPVVPPNTQASALQQSVAVVYLATAAQSYIAPLIGSLGDNGPFSGSFQYTNFNINDPVFGGQAISAVEQAVVQLCNTTDRHGITLIQDPMACVTALQSQYNLLNGPPNVDVPSYPSSVLEYKLTGYQSGATVLDLSGNQILNQFIQYQLEVSQPTGSGKYSYDMGLSINQAPANANFQYNNAPYPLSNIGVSTALVNNFPSVMATSNGTALVCLNQQNCNLQSVVDAVQAGITSSVKNQQSKKLLGGSVGNMPVPGTGNTCDWTCRDGNNNPITADQLAYPSLDGVPVCMAPAANGKPSAQDPNATASNECFTKYTDANGNTTYQPAGNGNGTPTSFNNSWWYAGEVYLGLANQMAQTSNTAGIASQAIDAGTNTAPIFGGNFTTAFNANLSMNYAQNQSMFNNPGNGGVWQYWGWSPNYSGDVSPAVNITLNVPGHSPADVVGTWSDAVTYLFTGYNPYSDPTGKHLSDLQGYIMNLQNFPFQYQAYQGLLNLPNQYRGAFYILAALAQSGQAGFATAVCTANSTCTFSPLINQIISMYSVLVANNLVANPWVNTVTSKPITGPIEQVMNSIFGGLLGGDLGLGVSGQVGYNNSQSDSNNITNLMGQIYNMGQVTSDITQVPQQQMDMIADAQSIGVSMIGTVIGSIKDISYNYTSAAQGDMDVIGGTAGAAMGAGLAAAALPFSSAGAAIVSAGQLAVQLETLVAMTEMSMHLVWLPLAIMVMTCLFTTGIIFSILIPITPFILFWGGEVAWILGVIEAMIAAPIIMLGMAHPGGHNILGHAVPAVKIFLGILFRPVLMVLGLLIGIVLTFILISLSAQGFHAVADSILGLSATGTNVSQVSSMDPTTQGILASIMVMVYAAFLGLAFNKCFSAIYVFPEKVVQWIGGQAEKVGPEDLQQITQATQQTSQQAAQAGGQGLTAKTDATKQEVQGASGAASQGISGAGQTSQALSQDKDKMQNAKGSGGTGGGGDIPPVG